MPDANLFIERRVNPRISIKLPVKYRVIAGQDEIKAIDVSENDEITTQTLNVSLGGVCLLTDQRLKVGSHLRLNITLPKFSCEISAFAEVVWSNNSGAGLHFDAMKEEDRDKLKNYLSLTSAGK